MNKGLHWLIQCPTFISKLAKPKDTEVHILISPIDLSRKPFFKHIFFRNANCKPNYRTFMNIDIDLVDVYRFKWSHLSG